MKKKYTSMFSIIMSIMLLTTFSCNDKKWSESASEESSFSETSTYQESSAEEYSSVEDSSIEDSSADEEPEQPVLPEYEPDPAPTSPIVAQLPKIAAGESTAYVINEEGKLWVWGNNENGRVGNGKKTSLEADWNAYTPQAIMPEHTFQSISASLYHALALDEDGKLWGWGHFAPSEEIFGATMGVVSPLQTLSWNTFVWVASGTNCSYAIDTDGSLWAWGINSNGQLGNGKVEYNEITTDMVMLGTQFRCVDADGNVVYAIDKDGQLWGWGTPYTRSSLGNGTKEKSYTPIQIMPEEKFSLVSTSYGRTYAIDQKGRLWGWGIGGFLGDGTKQTQTSPVQIMTGKYFTHVDVYKNRTVAIDVQGKSWAWGYSPAMGVGMEQTIFYPAPINGEHTFAQMVVGDNFTLAMDTNGEFWRWGLNDDGVLGLGIDEHILRPTQVREDMRFKWVNCLDRVIFAVDSEDNLWQWGSGVENGMEQIAPGQKFKCAVAGVDHYLAIDTEGRLWGWGKNNKGQLGNGTTESVQGLTQIMPGYLFTYIEAGEQVSFAIDINGALWAWGNASKGITGTGTTSKVLTTPMQVKKGTRFQEVTCCIDDWNYVLAIDEKGTLWGWGNNSHNGLGLDITPIEQGIEPIPVRIIEGVFHVNAPKYDREDSCTLGDSIYYFIDTEGRLGMWNGRKPFKFLKSAVYIKLSRGCDHLLLLDSYGRLHTIGEKNNCGQLGNGTLGEIIKDEEALGEGYDFPLMRDKCFSCISAGESSSFAIDTEGKLYAWGKNTYGALLGEKPIKYLFAPQKIEL